VTEERFYSDHIDQFGDSHRLFVPLENQSTVRFQYSQAFREPPTNIFTPGQAIERTILLRHITVLAGADEVRGIEHDEIESIIGKIHLAKVMDLIGPDVACAIAVVQIDVQNPKDASAAVDALRKVDAIASVRLVDLEKV